MSDHIEYLRRHNEWRRGNDQPQPDPMLLGKAIDATIAEVETLRSAIDRCYQMLLTEPNVTGALFRAENILREARAK